MTWFRTQSCNSFKRKCSYKERIMVLQLLLLLNDRIFRSVVWILVSIKDK